MIVTVRVRLAHVEGRKLHFEVEADDGAEIISRGSHERFIIDAARFRDRIAQKLARHIPPGD